MNKQISNIDQWLEDTDYMLPRVLLMLFFFVILIGALWRQAGII